ncbi:MAG: tetratricopeptide repeat protein [Ignavibacteriales bacterium]|nr:MAG: tetratricopeptide repeat protein [Ignavibacteriaceae bacterium]MBW7872646.1 tetratricopeptide repeat protein [Ignavibacteria bacterium]MCZ2141800.1 tetratricopeptide repeat protein [Ignavibacteriales bacterium]OQY71422.1 MAG: hypothetical protein B6D45_10085 [Ignavibacteriales bacterium UTCHB3]MBV6444969.1 hypothetical protein [Ignavibacteriaceae bacterium]
MKKTILLSLFLVMGAFILSASETGAQSLKKANKLLENESYTNALIEYNDLVKEEPGNVMYGYYLVNAYLQVERIDSAGMVLQRYEAAGAGDPYYLLASAALALNSKNNQLAKDLITQALTKVSSEKKDMIVYDPDFLVAMANSVAFGRGDKDVCELGIDAILKTLSVDSKNYDLLIAAGKLYYTVPDGTNALKYYKAALDIEDNKPAAYVGYGLVYRLIAQYGSAEIEFQKALAIDPDYAPAYREIAEMNNQMEDYPKAIQFYKEYLARSEKTLLNLRRYAIIQYNGSDYQGTIATTEEFLREDPNNADMLKLEAYSYNNLGDSVKVVELMDRFFDAAKSDPTKVKAYDYELYGNAQKKLGNELATVKAYEKAVELDSTKSLLLTDVAAYYFKEKNWDMAIYYYQLKERIENGLSLVEYFALGRAYFFAKKYTEGAEAFDVLLKNKPDFAIGYYWKGNCETQIEAHDSSKVGLARVSYEKFIELASAEPSKYKAQLISAYDYMGFFYYSQKDNPEYKSTWAASARNAYQQILSLDPSNKSAADNLKAIPK